MKTKFIYILSILLLVSTVSMAQPKPKPEKPSKEAVQAARGLRYILTEMQKTDKIVGAKRFDCDALPYLKAIPAKKKVPRLYTVARAIDTLFERIRFILPAPHQRERYTTVMDAFIYSDSYEDFVKILTKENDDIDLGQYGDKTRKIYKALLPMKQSRYILHEENFKTKTCEYKITTSINYDPKQFSEKFKKQAMKPLLKVTWDVFTTITMNCSCAGKDKTAVKSAAFEYSGKAYSIGGIYSSFHDRKGYANFIDSPSFPTTEEQTQYFLRLRDVVCCPEKEPKTEDGSFMDPNEDEDIAFPNQFLEVGAGVATAKDEETELCAMVGFMHNLFSEEEDNALFIGARAKVNKASFSMSDFNQTTINVGPAVEYQSIIGNTYTKWINGVNGSFVFGSQSSGEFKNDISGINVGLYTGVEVPLGNQFALGIMATLLELNNLTFKSDGGEFESNTTGFNLNKGAVSASLRINLDAN